MAGIIGIIGEMVRNIAVLAILSLFWDILLPKGKIKAFAQAVLGLMVVLVILSPLGKLFNTDISSISWQDYQDINSGGIISAGTNLEGEWQKKAAKSYQESLAKQIKSLVMLVDNVADVEVKIKLKDYKSLNKIDLLITPKKAVKDEKALRKQVEATIGDFYGLESKQIDVYLASKAE